MVECVCVLEYKHENITMYILANMKTYILVFAHRQPHLYICTMPTH